MLHGKIYSVFWGVDLFVVARLYVQQVVNFNGLGQCRVAGRTYVPPKPQRSNPMHIRCDKALDAEATNATQKSTKAYFLG